MYTLICIYSDGFEVSWDYDTIDEALRELVYLCHSAFLKESVVLEELSHEVAHYIPSDDREDWFSPDDYEEEECDYYPLPPECEGCETMHEWVQWAESL